MLFALVACSSIVDTDKSQLGAMPIPCEVNQSAICPCPDGSKSTQTCNAQARYDACLCSGTPRAGQSSAGGGGRAGEGGAAGLGGQSGAAGRR